MNNRRVRRMLPTGLLLATLTSTLSAAWADDTASKASAPRFQTSDRCLACHNDLHGVTGEDVSIGADWQVSLMANSSRDPYWQASVRRETIDHGTSKAGIEDECAACHMPIPRYEAKLKGALGTVFQHLPLGKNADKAAADGVSCSVCHQITPDNLGAPASFSGQFTIRGPDASGAHAEFGPFDIDPGLMQVMRTSTGGFEPRRGDHIQTSELCASCHTLITKALDSAGQVVGSLPEQMPYQEWLHSDFREKRTCQSCHMPVARADAPVTRVLGINRPAVSRHEFVAANFVMQRVFARYNDELGVSSGGPEFAAAADRTAHYLRSEAAKLTVSKPELRAGRLEADVTVENLGGHKLPTAFPARRAWLHVVVRDRDRRMVFESGALQDDGSIRGNDNDADPTRYEPHYAQIRSSDEVQIYESILGDTHGGVTTGLLSAVGYLKDNRLLPHGFDKATATPEIAVHGAAATDAGFDDRGHRIRYSVDVGSAPGPFEIQVQLWYQPIGYRWARNLSSYDAPEALRFAGYFDAMRNDTATLLQDVAETSR